MSNYNRKEPGPSKNSDQEWIERLNRGGENIYREGEPGREFDSHRRRESPVIRRTDRNDDRSDQTFRKDESESGYYGSPYDVGNYASHYDENYNPGDQLTGTQQPSGKFDHRGKGPRGYQRSDERILEDVNDRLYLDPYVDASDIEVKVDKCDVTLTGTVGDRNAKRLAEDLVYSIPGVKNVENRLRVTQTHIAGPVRSNAREELM